MADLTQTPANVAYIEGPRSGGVAGEDITRGMPITINRDDEDKIYQCDASAGWSSVCYGVAMSTALADEDVTYAEDGAVVDLGATLPLAECLVVSANKGKIAPFADLTAAEYVSKIALARNTSGITRLNIMNLGVKKATTVSGNLIQTQSEVFHLMGRLEYGIAASPINRGWPLYRDDTTASGNLYTTDADALDTASIVGVSVSSPAVGTLIFAPAFSIIDIGADLTVGEIYVCSGTINNIMPYSDLVTGQFASVIGGALTTRLLYVKPDASGVAIP